MRTLVFVPAVGLVAALLGSPTIGSREDSPTQSLINGKPTGSSNQCDDQHRSPDPVAERPMIESAGFNPKPAE